MPESSSPTNVPATTTDLAAQVAAAAVATPGVARLVPGLKGAIARLRRSASATREGADAADGVTVVTDGNGLRVVIDIGVRPQAVVIDTARAVRAAAEAVVRVNVLAWEPESSAPTEPSPDQTVR